MIYMSQVAIGKKKMGAKKLGSSSGGLSMDAINGSNNTGSANSGASSGGSNDISISGFDEVLTCVLLMCTHTHMRRKKHAHGQTNQYGVFYAGPIYT